MIARRWTLEDEPFAGCTGRGVTVAVLDSGIHAEHPHVVRVLGGASFVADSDGTDLVDRIGHGTAVAAVIREKSPDVELLAVKVFHRQLSTSAEVLAGAIVWAADEGAQLINLSLGTANAAHAEILAVAINYALDHGSAVISARESNGVVWLPGALPRVIGVMADESLDRNEIELTANGGGMCYFASPYPRPIPNVPRERNLSGVSFAVANVTGFLARAVEAAGGSVSGAGLANVAR